MQNNEENAPEGISGGDVIKVAAKLSKWKTYLIYLLLGLIAAEGVGLLWLRGSLATAKEAVVRKEKDMDRIKTERDIAKTNEQSCRANLDKQNTDIGEAGKRYKKLQDEMDKLKADIDSGKYYQPAEEVKKQPVPKTCQETLDFFNRNFP